MKKRRDMLLAALPLIAGGAILLVAISLRREPSRIRTDSKPPSAVMVKQVPPPPRAPAPTRAPDTVSAALHEARVRATYDNYRTALVTRNRVLEETLLPVLRRDRDLAIFYAEEETAFAADEPAKETARRIVAILKE